MADYYRTLGVPYGASDDDIHRAYCTASEHHTGALKEASDAHKVLSDPRQKAVYDAQLSRLHLHGSSFAPLQPEDTHVQSQLTTMRPAVEREYGDWKYEFRLSKYYKMRANTKPSECNGVNYPFKNQLYIFVELQRDGLSKTTEDIYIVILKAPGVVDEFETYFKERLDGTCYLTIALRVHPFSGYGQLSMPLPIELPINFALRENWVPLHSPLNAVVRATHFRFYGERINVPEDEDLPKLIVDKEMHHAEKVPIMEEARKIMSYERRLWKRIAEMSYIRFWV